MSENLNILEGDLGRQFAPVDRLSVNNQGGGESRWVVADFLDISTLDASENGLYLAAEDDCDVYEEVEVDVSTDLEDADDETKATKKITGTGGDGNDYAVGLDENGNLTSEMVPSAIHIVIKPRKLEYEEGETLDFTGIHVYLMDGNNKRYTDANYPTGEIPFDELVFPVTIAEVQGGHKINTLPEALRNYISPPVPFYISSKFNFESLYNWMDVYKFSKPVSAAFFLSDSGLAIFVFASTTEFTYGHSSYKKDQDEPDVRMDTVSGPSTYDTKTVFYSAISTGWLGREYDFTSIYQNYYQRIFQLSSLIAWNLIYGDVSGGGTEIPVQWIRSDGETLNDSFYIDVTTKDENISDSGISDSGSGHTSGGF